MRVQFYSRVTPRRSFVVVAAAAHYGLKNVEHVDACLHENRPAGVRCPSSVLRWP